VNEREREGRGEIERAREGRREGERQTDRQTHTLTHTHTHTHKHTHINTKRETERERAREREKEGERGGGRKRGREKEREGVSVCVFACLCVGESACSRASAAKTESKYITEVEELQSYICCIVLLLSKRHQNLGRRSSTFGNCGKLLYGYMFTFTRTRQKGAFNFLLTPMDE